MKIGQVEMVNVGTLVSQGHPYGKMEEIVFTPRRSSNAQACVLGSLKLWREKELEQRYI